MSRSTSARRSADSLRPKRLALSDLLRVGMSGLVSRKTRTALSALGIAIGIAAMAAVVGISASSQAQVERQLAALGTNLLTVQPGQSFSGDKVPLPTTAVAMVKRIKPVQRVASTASLTQNVFRNEFIPEGQTGGMNVVAADVSLKDTLSLSMAAGHWLSTGTAKLPIAVLGADAAKSLGIADRLGQRSVIIGGHRFAVAGILAKSPLVGAIDGSVFIGKAVAASAFGFDGTPDSIYLRADDAQVENVRQVLGATVNPAAPSTMQVSRPSDALQAQRATDQAFTALLLGLGAVALLVGGVGIANTMVVSVLERRAEIGLRRSFGATRGQIRMQFLSESALLSLLGGVAGVLLGGIATALYARLQGWPAVMPIWVSVGGVVATVLIGALAGLYPSIKAARMSPTEALTAP